jgi:hypothetical protein
MLKPASDDFELTLWFASADHLASAVMDESALMASMFGPHVDIDSIRFIHGPAAQRGGDRSRGERIGVLVSGRACG